MTILRYWPTIMTILRYLAKKYYDSTIQAENIDDITILGGTSSVFYHASFTVVVINENGDIQKEWRAAKTSEFCYGFAYCPTNQWVLSAHKKFVRAWNLQGQLSRWVLYS